MVRLPVEYQEVEYIQGTSNARIDTGIPGNNDSLVVSGKVYFNKFSAYQGFFGNYIDEDHNVSRLILYSSANGAVIVDINRRAGNSSAPKIGFYAGNVGEFKVNKTKLVFNGTEYSYGGVNNATVNDTNILLNVSDPAASTSNSELYRRWYYFQINDGDTMLRNFIPCYRKSDSEPGMYDTVTKQFFTNAGTGTFLVGNDVSWDTASLIERRRQILLNTPHLTSESANPLTFQTDISANLKDCKIYFEPVQEGTGDPSPDNVRPITGWDGVTITRCGKNLVLSDDPEKPNDNYYHSSTGSIAYSTEEGAFYSAGGGVGYAAHDLKNGTKSRLFTAPADMTATFSLFYKNIGTNYGLRFYYNNSRVQDIHGAVDETWHKFSYTRNMVKGDYIQIVIYGNIYFKDIQLELGSEATAYEPYTGTSLTIPFPQTIYGGYVDLSKGEVVEEWSQIASYNGETLPGEWVSDHDVYTAGTSPTIGAQVAYKLATPIAHQLTSQVIKTLKGINNIWSDANGNIEVKFWKH